MITYVLACNTGIYTYRGNQLSINSNTMYATVPISNFAHTITYKPIPTSDYA